MVLKQDFEIEKIKNTRRIVITVKSWIGASGSLADYICKRIELMNLQASNIQKDWSWADHITEGGFVSIF